MNKSTDDFCKDNTERQSQTEDKSRGIQPSFQDPEFVDLSGERAKHLKAKNQQLQRENDLFKKEIADLKQENEKEKHDFLEEKFTLLKENDTLRINILNLRDLLDSGVKCKLCFSKELQVIFEPCLHIFSCQDCARGLNNICPVCRTNIVNIKNVYLA